MKQGNNRGNIGIGLFVALGIAACSGEDSTAAGNNGDAGAGGSGPGSGGAMTTGGAGGAANTSGGAAGGGNPSGGGGTPSGGAGGTSGSGGTGTGGAPSGQPFVPSGIAIEYVGQGPSGGLEVIAFTLVAQAGISQAPALYVAVKNTGTQVICIVDVPVSFLDSAGVEIGKSIGAGSLSAPMYDSFGSPTACIGPGDIGMGTITLGLSGLDVTKVAKIEHGFTGNIDANATKLTGVSAANPTVETTAAGNKHVVGTINNGLTSSISDPDVHVFFVDSVGRPYGEVSDLQYGTSVPAGGSVPFDTTFSDDAAVPFVTYVKFDMP